MLMWCDNFEPYGFSGSSVLMREGLYAGQSADIVPDPDPSGTGQPTLTSALSTTEQTRRVFPSTYNTVGIGFRLYLPSLFSVDNQATWVLRDVSNNYLARLSLRTTGAIIFENAIGTVLAESDGPVIVARSKQHIEWKTTLDSAAGAVEVRVDGVTVLSATDLILTDIPAAQLAITTDSGADAGIYNITDLIAWNDEGTQNNDFFGTVFVETMSLVSDVTLGGWTLTGGATGFGILSQVPPNDADFIDSVIPPTDPCQFTLSPLPADVTSVRALQTVVRAKKIDGGDGNIQVSLVSDGSSADGTNRPITPTSTYWFDIQELDPATSAQWLPSAANAAQPKINRTV